MTAEKRVALFVTCIVDQLMPEVGVATVRLLRRAGFEVSFPREQTCCGQPFFNSGFRDQARKLAERTVAIFADEPAVVLPSGSCTTMIRKEYPHLLGDNPRYAYRARRLAARTFELSEFLVHQAGWEPPPGEPHGPVTYHDSCHMCRMLGLRAEPRRLLAQSGHEIVEMAESDRCCGFGGVFSVRMPEISNAMTAEKLQQAADTGAPLLVTADPGCLMQMRGLAGESAGQVRHLATVLEEATR
ncbi:MAG: (Fe-S)-binding protein [Chloroflexi bacterium]|nr:(Fe-S)-binding protein [Chloroflexota bacterium]